ncbi:hypothetical protein [Magnetospirillum sp. UT-4]|uniref:hypothetical protein n=1 Tax=Magnetospirillum sp. UT-4 TaxID=2681467 RepID=UPI001380776F|nr:hypothetical protein [Magnetospirillum sp. UT-4]CAA7621094.1 hypothetical protein MTBUT4_380005 [Magnetospirillum sp. UT-4]
MTARVITDRGLVYVEASLAQLQAAGLLTWWPSPDGDGPVIKMACLSPREADAFATQVNLRARGHRPRPATTNPG